MRIIITGGGTGGHIYPGISLAKELQKRDSKNEVIFVGSNRGMESDIIPREGYQFFSLKVRGIRRKMCLESIYAILLFLGSLVTAYKMIRKIKPNIVIGTGGYVSASVALISSIIGIPTFIHEQNAIPGITNQILSLTSRIVFLSFPESRNHFWRKGKTICVGNPIREEIWKGDREKIIKETGMDKDKKTILLFGGSKGARVLTNTFLNCVDLINDTFWNSWQVLIISGKEEHAEVKKLLTNSKYKGVIFVFPYLYEMGNAYELADLVICRAGATTVAELTAKGLPAILIPYPYATGDHQVYNAQYLEKKQAAVVITQQDLSEDKLASEISRLLSEEKYLKTLAQNSKKLGNRKAAEEIINFIYKNIKKEEIL
jgi:UDP-N-acetylglucosamine--N-acetylmuramyl-(pentapeptide) pyrophosphoryl-undecaprenol N-acetylglucosamine transferase